MRQYELAIRVAQIHHLVDERKYKKALAVIQTLDVRQIRSLSDLKVLAEVYTKTEQYEAAKATYLRIYRRSRTRRVLYRLIYLSIRTNALEDAEAYYQEFIHMNPNARDALILRYRIDKASGVPIGRLIEILQELKQEEYIEEWAYELAKLYHRAGRREECLRECEDILLWFGTGEIVERAKILIDHLKEQDLMPYYDDKDFTVPGKEEPNPEDTGSLPDLNEFIKERKAQKKEERRLEKLARKEDYEEDYDEEDYEEADEEEDLVAFDKKEAFAETDTLDEELAAETAQKVKEKEEAEKEADDTFIDDYEEDYEDDAIIFSQRAKDGIQKISDILKLNKKEEQEVEENVVQKPEAVEEKKSKQERVQYIPHSQSGTGITQDLAKEISAIYEMEHREQLKEKAVTVVNEVPNLATSVVDRMTQAIQKSAGKGYIPIDVEEIYGKADTVDLAKTKDVLAEEAAVDLAKTKDVLAGEPERKEKPVENLPEEYTEAPAENLPEEPAEILSEVRLEETEQKESIADTGKSEAELLKDLLEEEIEEPDMQDDSVAEEPEEKEASVQDSAVKEDVNFALENYEAPKIPVVETEYMEMPEITYEDLPTTRALQQSFKNVLRLIAGELDPSHFVLMGDGSDRIIGVSKQIVRVMKETGYLSKGRIAKISAEQLNRMDLISFRSQLKGNCLLIEEAADLLFPTITKIFSIMEEYYGDFVVILADEGTTLDQLFRFVPVLAKKFKYIIDISKYTVDDYE